MEQIHKMQPVVLSGRGLVEIEGRDAPDFLDRILTVDVSDLKIGATRYGALLTPQGKILAEMIILRHDETRFFTDLAKTALPAFLQRLTLMKLRADLRLLDHSQGLSIAIGKGGKITYEDPRPWPADEARGLRTIVDVSEADARESQFQMSRIAAGLPEIGADYASGELYPHDVNLDQMQAIDFAKGCYVGQEVVSRMQHRGMARTRCLVAHTMTGNGPIMAGDKLVGQCAPATGGLALAFVRLDRLAEADPVILNCEGAPIRLQNPGYARWTERTNSENE